MGFLEVLDRRRCEIELVRAAGPQKVEAEGGSGASRHASPPCPISRAAWDGASHAAGSSASDRAVAGSLSVLPPLRMTSGKVSAINSQMLDQSASLSTR